jgi:hypothetical protein
MTSAAPAQGGKTMINLTDILLSADLLALPEAQKIIYTDMLQTLNFNTTCANKKIFEFYRTELPRMGWKTSMTETTHTDGKEVLAFRNESNDLVTISVGKGTGNVLQVTLQLQTVAQIDEMNKKLDAQAAAYRAKHGIK